MAEKHYLAVDLGAESGRVMLGTLAEGELSLEEIHRFPNEPVTVRGTMHWDVLALYNNILKGIRAYVQSFGSRAAGIGVDTWGVDFALLASDGALLQNPVHYRDSRTDGLPEKVTGVMPERDIYRRTGINLLPIYTLCQMVSLRRADSPALGAADRFVMMGDLFGYFLTGRKAVERTNAITTQLYNPRRGDWDAELFETFDLPLEVMAEIIEPGTVLGELDDAVKADTGLESAPVIAPCTHDTASAVTAVPARGEDWAYLSSGTWSILGCLIDEVVTSDAAFEAHMSNELCLDGLRICRNIMGLWLLQQARAEWQRQGRTYSYPELVELGRQAPEGGALVDPNDEVFLAPENMVEEICDYCRRTGQQTPDNPAQVVRCILESLALSYHRNLRLLSEMLDRDFSTLHIVGGGSQNTLLSQFTADATGLRVLTGPVEATVAGNVLVQALAAGDVGSAQQIREIVRNSTEEVEYEPEDTAYWEDRYADYVRLVKG
ncbi:MAG: rhamnulokinase [Planctomycetota bacterium]